MAAALPFAWRSRALGALAASSARSNAHTSAQAFDLLVIGGGIVGCGVARDAALRGLRVALVEKGDFASGTSSRSSRLVHGGVRYLEHGHLHLVFESSRERRRLLRLAPHLVRPLSFTWPVYEGARVAQWKLLAGLTLYDALALFRNVGNHRRLTREAVMAREPALTTVGLVGGATYWDASTDDSRLTLANALGAVAAGAAVVNYTAVTALLHGTGRVTGAIVRDLVGGGDVTVRARCIVSAAGPWTDALQRLELPGPTGRAATTPSDADDAPSRAILGSAGTHIAVARERIGNESAITLVAPSDGRVMFVLPAGEQAIVGTTETPAKAGPDEIRATREEVRYLLDACNANFPAAMLRDVDVISAWAGIRPLAASLADHEAGSASREHTIAEGAEGVLWVTGGKLTTYRAMAEDVVDRACQQLGLEDRPGRPNREVVLPGGAMQSLSATEADARVGVGDEAIAMRLAAAYGCDWRHVWQLTREDPWLRERMDDAHPYTLAEAAYAFSHEMAMTLGDVLLRRTHLAFELRDHGVAAAGRLATRLAPRLGWDAAQVTAELVRYEREVARIFSIGS
ncbi:MAG: glycerol-3-phosphate dehydrogenase/oxidase [Gemmatimonadaceae bacterium]|nr:glycerol-3-phosphate dehydrogenase/oxidase [Gemmatimonadaceae bacterium]